MTFKHKLSHRLARLRVSVALLALLPVAACTEGDLGSLAPYESMTLAGKRDFSISPKSVVVESGKAVNFKSSSDNPEAVKWTTTGGTISSDGAFISSTEGDFLIVSRVSLSGGEKVDTARVRVVRQQADRDLTVSPRSAELLPGQSVHFSVTATLSDGSTTEAKVNWKVSGGEVDQQDNYIAGQVPGTYPLVAFIPSAGVADTVLVTIKPSTRRMVRLLLAPATAAVVTGGVVMYAATAQYEDGGTEPAWAEFSATGGTISPNGQEATYTAPNTTGTYTVTAKTPDGTMTASGEVSVTSSGGDKAEEPVATQPDPVTQPSSPTPISSDEILFYDDFASGNLSRTMNGWSWSPANVSIVSGFSKDGNVGHSARFNFAGSSDMSEDAWSELRFKVGTPDLREVWATFWVYYPSGTESPYRGPKFVHRNASPTNNKFFKLYENYDTGYLMSSTSTWADSSTGNGFLVPNWRNGTGVVQHYWTAKTPWENVRGQWIKLEVYTKAASAVGAADGIMQYYKDGQLVVDIRNVDGYQLMGENEWKAGYLFGWANSGFTDTTYAYISNVTFSRSRLR